jgi:hypothetical protein
MDTLDKDIFELRHRLADGSIQRAYKGIVSYMSRLRKVFADQRGERAISGLYQGYFDMTYFALFSDPLKKRELKLAVVFNYDTFGYEVWLAARNRKVQKQYWELLSNNGYKTYKLVEPAVGIDAIVMAMLVADYSMKNENCLTEQIINGVKLFERDIVLFLDKIDAR